MSAPARRVAQRAPARKPPQPAPAAAPARVRPRTVAPRTTKRPLVSRSTVVFVVATGVIVTVMVLGLVALNALLAQTSFKIDDLQGRVQRLTLANQANRLEASMLSSPARIAREATKIGYQDPPGGIIVLSTQPHHPRPTGRAVGGRP